MRLCALPGASQAPGSVGWAVGRLQQRHGNGHGMARHGMEGHPQPRAGHTAVQEQAEVAALPLGNEGLALGVHAHEAAIHAQLVPDLQDAAHKEREAGAAALPPKHEAAIHTQFVPTRW